jgi:hypothetical protein
MLTYRRCLTLIKNQVSRNILFFAVGITFFIANVSDFTRILLVKITNFELSYLHKKLSYASIFLIIKVTCFKALYYNIFKYKKILSAFFLFPFFDIFCSRFQNIYQIEQQLFFVYLIEFNELCQLHFRFFKNINFSWRYPRKCVKKEYPRFCSPKR